MFRWCPNFVSLCNLCVLCVSVVVVSCIPNNHRDTENTEVAQRRTQTRALPMFPVRSLQCGSFEVVDEVEEDVDVDGFRDQSEVAHSEGALAVLFAGVARDGDGGHVTQAGQKAQLFE